MKWGLLAALIADQKIELAQEQIQKIDIALEDELEAGASPFEKKLAAAQDENMGTTPNPSNNSKAGKFGIPPMARKDIIRARTWLLHWTMFVVFRAPGTSSTAQQKAVDFLVSEKYLALVSLSAPWLLRYVAAALLLHKQLKPLTKDIVHVINQDREQYSDPVTEFILALYQDLDFNKAESCLKEMMTLAQSDFFLWGSVEALINNARLGVGVSKSFAAIRI